jgi:hypothetical protein
MHYKDLQNKLYFLDDDSFAYNLPVGCVPITDDEAKSLQPQISYVDLRAYAYPPITDYIDGIVKGDMAQQQAYIEACLAVKDKYPK